MEIIFDGQQDSMEASDNLLSVLKLFKERYKIGRFREIHLSLTLVDDAGEDVELIDSKTNQPYRVFEVYRDQKAYHFSRGRKQIGLKLVVDNTDKSG